jgi:glycosyltransferase involved in cell wall biosynthesis
MNVVALHRPAKVSGVSTAGRSAAQLKPPFTAWRPLIIGESLTRADLQQSPLADAPGADFCTWEAGADAIDQVLTVRAMLRAMRADVVVSNDLPHAFVAAGLDHHRGLRCAAWLHSASHDGEGLVTSCFDLADAWRAVSHEGRRRTIATAAELNITVPPPRATAPAFLDVPLSPDPLPPGDTLRLLYAGRLEKYHKRILDVARLCDALAAFNTPFHLTIAGDGTAAGELRTALSPHLAANRITLAGSVSTTRMTSLLRDHHFLVLVSGSEAAPMCVMEAMAAGRPAAITTSCGEAVYWVRDGIDGVHAPTGDMPALAARLASLASDPRALAAMSQAAWSRATELFAPSVRAPALQALVTEAAAAPTDHSQDAVQTRWARILHALHAIGPVQPQRLAWLADVWTSELRASGISTQNLSLPTTILHRPSPAERRLQAVLRNLRTEGHTRVALYGAGRHTQGLKHTLEMAHEVVAIIDDAAGQSHGPPPTIARKPVLAPSQFPLLDVHALIISSDEHERELFARATTFARNIIPLYEPGLAAAPVSHSHAA